MPLVIFGDFLSPFHFGKALIFRSLVQLMTVVYVFILVRYGKDYLFPRTKLFWSISIFTLVFGLTTLTSFDFYNSFWGTLERMGGWFGFLHFWLFFVIASAVLRKKEHWLILINVSIFTSLLSVFYGLLQKTQVDWVLGSGNRQKIFGTLGNPALFAGYVVVNAFLALTLALRPGSRGMLKFWQLLTFGLGFLGVFLTGVRGSFLSIVIGVLIFFFLYAIDLNSRKVKKIALGFLVLVLISAGTLSLLKDTSFIKGNSYLARYSDISIYAYTVQTRVWAWKAGFDGFNDSLKTMIVGYGPENFNIPFSRHFNPNFYEGPGSETFFDRAHNQFIEILITMGIVGFIFYLSIFIYAFFNLRKLGNQQDSELKIYKNGILAALVAYMIHNFFIFDTNANYLVFFILVGFLNFLALPTGILVQNHSRPRRVALSYLATLILMVFFIFVFFTTTIKPARANYATTRAIVGAWAKSHDLAIQKYKEALSFDTFAKYEIRHRYAQYILEYYSGKEIDEQAEQELLLAADYAKKNSEEHPNDYLPHLYAGRSYILLGRTDSSSPYNDLALEEIQKALVISPTFVRTYYELGQAYLSKKDYPNAIAAFKKATELNPKVGQSWWYLGATQIEAGKDQEGSDSIKNAISAGYDFRNKEDDILRLVTYFVKRNDFLTVAGFYEQLIGIAPENAQYHASLAVAYSRIEKIDDAVKEAKTAASLDPDFEPEARAFVRSLGREW